MARKIHKYCGWICRRGICNLTAGCAMPNLTPQNTTPPIATAFLVFDVFSSFYFSFEAPLKMPVAKQEGFIPFQVSTVSTPCVTYYKLFGDLSNGNPPVIVLHGGPGGGHEYLLSFAELWTRFDLPVIFYDQIGCASSTHLPGKAGDGSFWQESLFIAELNNLIDYFKLRDGPGFHLLGQSWGGMFGANFAASRPYGLRHLVLANALASKDLAEQSIKLLRSRLPPDVREGIDEAEKDGLYDSPAYRRGLDMYMRMHMYRTKPFPGEELGPALTHLSEDKTVYGTMYGPSTITPIGCLKGWTSIPNLPRISAPTYIYNGDSDSSTDLVTRPLFELIPSVRWRTFPNSGHMSHLEESCREEVLISVGRFLTQNG